MTPADARTLAGQVSAPSAREAAVLLVDLDTETISYAGPAAVALPGAPRLPVSLLTYLDGIAAQLPDGNPLTADDGPVATLRAGEAVSNVAVRLAPPGQPPSDWMFTAVPLSGDLLHGRVLVLLVPDEGDAGTTGQALRNRAVSSTDMSFTITDPHQPDNPLVYVNPAFTRTTGYQPEQVLGLNCRLLQGPDTAPEAVKELRVAQLERRSVSTVLLNYRADGTPFWNQVSLSPVFDGEGALTHFVGVQSDVTLQVETERERERAFQAEQAARAEADRAREVAESARHDAERARGEAEIAQQRLALLAEATTMLTATLDVPTMLQRLAALAVPVLADGCAIDLEDPPGRRRREVAVHVRPEAQDALQALGALPEGDLQRDDGMIATTLRSGQARLLTDLDEQAVTLLSVSERQAGLRRRIGVRSLLMVPLRARRRSLGVLSLYNGPERRQFSERDLELVADLGRRAALALDNARLYQREHEVAEALQRSLLPLVPDVPGLAVAARYLPSGRAAEVGGDWYDVLPLPDGAVGLAVGDVMGHDLSAAAAMGQLRSVLRSYAWEGGAPSSVLDRLDRLVQGLSMAQLATVLYGRLEDRPVEHEAAGRRHADDPDRGVEAAGKVFRWANAGHLPPVLVAPDGTATLLREAQSLLVGAFLGQDRDEAQAELPPGATLLLYTDGLVERRDDDIEAGLAWLTTVASGHDVAIGPEALLDRVLGSVDVAELADDAAMLAVQVLAEADAPARPSGPAGVSPSRR